MLTFIFEDYPKAYTTFKQFEETTVSESLDEATQIHIEGEPEDYPKVYTTSKQIEDYGKVYTTSKQFEESTVSENFEEALQNEGNLE